MTTPTYIKQELRCIDPLYFAVFDKQKEVWKIRKWKSIHPINHKIDNWRFVSTNIMTIDDELDMRVIHAMQEGFYWARHAMELVRDIDESNKELERKHSIETELIGRDAAKAIWGHYREPSVYLSGKSWRK